MYTMVCSEILCDYKNSKDLKNWKIQLTTKILEMTMTQDCGTIFHLLEYGSYA